MQEEEILQTLCVNWYKSHTQPAAWPLLIHVPNERKCSRQRGALLRGMGVTAGVADLIFFRANNNHHGLCIELKTPTGRQRDSQKTWQEQGYILYFSYLFLLVIRYRSESVYYGARWSRNDLFVLRPQDGQLVARRWLCLLARRRR